ncbi:lipoate--protein ligase [Raoultibacter massiliensis]|uniref:lipoate--protein ligase n=1 Tax=Raoultibacter massiliensis TaxID=1852371 RepID=UPI000C85DA1A|nr:lipoate--protein ligase [Raoultibacter massiliensis]
MTAHDETTKAPGSSAFDHAPMPRFLISESTDPYRNIATEEALVDAALPGECILFLWQNENTIVIGRNQNPWKECRIAEFEADGGRIARRLSGGGAVFHDIGNLNFTFVARGEAYDVSRHMNVMCAAVQSFGLAARVSGRNDATVDGAKFSGNAFFRSNERKCHHGTLMIDVDTGKLARYLQPDSKKLAAKGVESVRSRVVNLASLNSRVTVETLSIALVEAFSEACGTPAKPLDPARLDECNIEQRRARFASHAWIFGHTAPFNHALGDRFAWGNLDIELSIKGGEIEHASIFSDALDAEFIARLSDSLEGCRYDKDGIGKCLEALEPETDEQQTMRADCLGLFRSDF